MVTNELVEAETQGRRRVAIVAALAAILMISPMLLSGALLGSEATDNALSEALDRTQERGPLIVLTVITVLAMVCTLYTLWFLLQAARARDERVQKFLPGLLLVGGIATPLFQLGLLFFSLSRLDHWVADSTLTWQELSETSSFIALIYVGLAAQLAFTFSFALTCLHAMRVGLLTRFLGYLGVISAVISVLPLPLMIVQAVWLVNVALLLWNVRSPRQPPAWVTGEAVAWPSAADVREQRVRAAEARRGGAETAPARPSLFGRRDAEPEPEPVEDDGEAGAADPRVPEHARRKRKKRR